jgi:hypothetical protein
VTLTPGIRTPLPNDIEDSDGNAVEFDPDIAPTAAVRGTGTQSATLGDVDISAEIDPDTGELIVEITVPEDTPSQIVMVTIRAVDSRGLTRSIVYLIPVGGGGTTTSTGATEVAWLLRRPAAAPSVKGVRYEHLATIPEADLPVVVKQIEAAIPDDATEQALLAELAVDPDTVLDFDEAALAVSVRRIRDAGDSQRSLFAAMVVALVGIGLVATRRRKMAGLLEESR